MYEPSVLWARELPGFDWKPRAVCYLQLLYQVVVGFPSHLPASQHAGPEQIRSTANDKNAHQNKRKTTKITIIPNTWSLELLVLCSLS